HPPPAAPAGRREGPARPPLQRTIGDHPLVDPPGRFGDSLASWQNPGFLAPLGHVVPPGEPSGVVEGIAVARAVPDAPALPVVARKPAKGGGAVARMSA